MESRLQSNSDGKPIFYLWSIETRLLLNCDGNSNAYNVESRLQSNFDSLTNSSPRVEYGLQSNSENTSNFPFSRQLELQSNSGSISNCPTSMDFGLRVNSDNSTNFSTSNTDRNRYHLQPEKKWLPKATGWHFEEHSETGHTGQGLQYLPSVAPDLLMWRDSGHHCPEMDSVLDRNAYQLSYHENNGLFSANGGINSESSISPLSLQLQETDLNVIQGRHPPENQLPNSVSVRIDGLYSPTKLIHVEFPKNNHFDSQTEQSVENDDLMILSEFRATEFDIAIVEAGDFGTVRLLKTLAGDSTGTLAEFSFPFLKKNITYEISITMKLFNMQEVMNDTTSAKLYPRTFIKSAIVLIYDVTIEDCVNALSTLVPFVVDVIQDKIPIFLVGNTSDVMTHLPINSADKKRQRCLDQKYGDHLIHKYELSGFKDISIESGEEVRDWLNEILACCFDLNA